MPQQPSKKSPLRIALTYFLVALLWIFYSEDLLILLAPNEITALMWQEHKIWLFVCISAVLVYWLVKDTTTRFHKSLEQKQETLRQLRQIMEHSQAAGFVYTPDTRELEILPHNAPFAAFQDSQRASIDKCIHPQDLPVFEEQIAHSFERPNEHFSCEIRIAPPEQNDSDDKNWHWVLLQGSSHHPVENGATARPRCTGSLLEIEARRNIEEKLRTANRAMQLIAACNESRNMATTEIELLSMVCRHLVEEGGYKFAWVGAPTTETASGVAIATSHGKPAAWAQQLPAILKSNTNHVTLATLSSLNISVERDMPASIPSGPLRDLAIASGFHAAIALPLVDNGEAIGALTLYTGQKTSFPSEELDTLAKVADDLTDSLLSLRRKAADSKMLAALEESEERFRATFEQAAVGICHLSLKGMFANVNATMCRLAGYNRQSLRTKKLSDLFFPEARQELDSGMHSLLNGAAKQFSIEQRLQRNEEEYFWCLTTISLAHNKWGAPAYFIVVVEDITSRKRIEQNIEAGRRELALLADAIPDYIARFDRELRHIFVNQALSRAIGIPREDFLGKTLAEMELAPETTSVLSNAILEVFQTGEECNIQFGLHNRGTSLVMHSRLAPDRDEQGRIRSVICVTRDISELENAHLALQASEKRLTDAQRIARMASYERDLVSGRGYWSDELYRLLGYAPGEVPNSLEQFLSHIHQDDRERIRNMFEEAKQRRNDFAAEFRYVRTNKQIRYGFVTGNITRDASGRAVHYQGILQDITERKRAAEEYSLLVTAIEQASEAISITTPEGVYQYVNPAFESTTGYSRSEVLGRTPRVLSSGHHDQTFHEALWRTIKNGQVWQGRFINRHRDGNLYEAESTISPVRDATGAIINFVALMRDVTEKNRLETQLRQAQKMEAIGTLAGGIAHDFNNILAAIMGFAEIALMEIPEEQVSVRDSLQDIITGSHRGAELVHNILTFSRQTPQDRNPIEVQPLVKESLKLLRSTLPSYIVIESNLSIDPMFVVAAPSELQQLVLNLCTNAGQAMGQNGGVLHIDLTRDAPTGAERAKYPTLENKEYLRLSVSDTGSGIPREYTERVFEPFFTTKAPGEGTGLGLSIVHGVVQDLKGTMDLESSPGEGTTVTILLPLAKQLQEEIPEADSKKRIIPGQGRILLVEDDDVVARSLTRMLKVLGYESTHTTDGLKALQLFETSPDAFDLLLTDQIMPGLRGLELAKALHTIRPDLPVLLISGYAESLDQKETERAGIRAILPKPLQLEDFSRELYAALVPLGQ